MFWETSVALKWSKTTFLSVHLHSVSKVLKYLIIIPKTDLCTVLISWWYRTSSVTEAELPPAHVYDTQQSVKLYFSFTFGDIKEEHSTPESILCRAPFCLKTLNPLRFFAHSCRQNWTGSAGVQPSLGHTTAAQSEVCPAGRCNVSLIPSTLTNFPGPADENIPAAWCCLLRASLWGGFSGFGHMMHVARGVCRARLPSWFWCHILSASPCWIFRSILFLIVQPFSVPLLEFVPELFREPSLGWFY